MEPTLKPTPLQLWLYAALDVLPLIIGIGTGLIASKELSVLLSVTIGVIALISVWSFLMIHELDEWINEIEQKLNNEHH